jgi:hypothetical protein
VAVAIGALAYLMLAATSIDAADTGFKSPTAEGGNHNQWSNGGSAYSSDDSYATETTEAEDQSYENFSFGIPSGATINGIEVKIEAKAGDAAGCEAQIALYNTGSGHSDYRDQAVTDSDTTYTVGGSSDTWGESWTDGDFSNGNFHAEIQFDDESSSSCSSTTFYLDLFQIKVYYTAQEVPDPLVSSPGLPAECVPYDIHLIVDSSGSIGPGLPTMQSNIVSMINQVEGQLPGTNWRGVTFRDPDVSAPSIVTNGGGWVAAPTNVINLINGMISNGYTPTAHGLDAAISGGVNSTLPNLALIITDGDPNVVFPGGNAPPADYWGGAMSAVPRADALRTAGFNTIAIMFGPGDSSAPGGTFSDDVLRGLAGPDDPSSVVGDVVDVGNVSNLGQALVDLVLDNCKGSVTIEKQTTPADAAQSFSFTSEDAAPANFELTDNGTRLFDDLTPGESYVFTETGESGWTLSDILCSGGADVDIDEPNNRVTVNLENEENVHCTFYNTLNQLPFQVRKDFVPNSGATVSITLTCASGTVSPAGAQNVTEAAPANWTVSGFTGNPNCTATENPVPAGYNSSGTCQAALSAGQCTITNTLRQAQFQVRKDFVPNSGATVSVTLTCASGTVSPAGAQNVTEAAPANWTVSGYTGDPSCTATENPVPAGYNSSGTCQAALSVGQCTITNTLRQAQFQVRKDFSPNSGATVSVTLTCASGTVSPAGAQNVTEASPATWTVSGYTGDPNCTATENPVPAGYNSSGTCQAALSAGQCTITNTLREADFRVRKDFSDNSTASVQVTLTCASGVVTPAGPQAVTEAAPASWHITGYTGDPNCTATESPVPAGYNSTGTCSAALSAGECTITNTLKQAQFQARKDFSDNSQAQVSVTLSCSSGTVSPAGAQNVSEGNPATWTVSGYTGDPVCTATENPVPAGYDSTGNCFASLSTGQCTITNTLRQAQFQVKKDFSDNSTAQVSVTLSCASGTVSPAGAQLVSEGNPATWTVSGYTGDPSCTATENPVPAGYDSAGSCQAALSVGQCTITNTLRQGQFQARKDFSDNSTAQVSVTLNCSSGTVTPADAQNVSEGNPANWTISGYTGDPICTATENPVPAGYDSTGNCFASLSTGHCTITNTLRQAQFQVKKDFSDNSGAQVSVSLSCASGTVSPAGTQNVSEGNPATWTVSGYTGDPNCTATENPVPAGYNSSGTCQAALSAGQCTITNTLREADFRVRKDFSDNSQASVQVTLTCASGTVTPAGPQAVAEAAPVSFHVTGFVGDPNCTATENPVPAGYNSSGTCQAALSAGECTITNTLRQAQFQVRKDFSDNSQAQVSVTLTCASGTVSPAGAQSVSEGNPANWTVSGYTGDPDCTATENPIPSGYISTGTCTGALVEDGGCTITNTLREGSFTVRKDFTDGNTASVQVTLVCTNGTVQAPVTRAVSEAAPATWTITGFNDAAATTCTATEDPIPSGYTSTGNCQATIAAGECTIVNALNEADFTVSKDFSDDNPNPVTVTLVCESGTITSANPQQVSEGNPATFHVEGFDGDPNCTATEDPIPSGYVSTGTCSALLSDEGCTIVNTLRVGDFMVLKDFIPDADGSVTVILVCESGVAEPASAQASEGSPASFTVSGYDGDPVCTATEDPVPAGYHSTATCQAAISVGQCTIVNELNSAEFTVRKDFSDDSAAAVTVTLTCESGDVTPASAQVTESTPAVFTVTGFVGDPNCTATEDPVPSGYDSTGTCNDLLVEVGECTITNTLRQAEFVVVKDFDDDNPDPVTVSLVCTSGSVSPESAEVSEGSPAVFTVSGYEGDPDCTATEDPIPAGYESTGTCAAALSEGECTIMNSFITPTPSPEPTPSPTPLAASATPVPTPATLPEAGGAPSSAATGVWQWVLVLLAALGLAGGFVYTGRSKRA